MALEITGKVIKVLPELSGTSAAGKSWIKQDFVIEEIEGQYPKKICFTGFGEKVVPVVKTLAPGQTVTVHFNVSSREYNEKWYSEISAWRIDKNNASAPAESGAPFTPASIATEEPGDDLPF